MDTLNQATHCSRTAQKRSHSQMSSGGHSFNTATTATTDPQSSSSSPWSFHRFLNPASEPQVAALTDVQQEGSPSRRHIGRDGLIRSEERHADIRPGRRMSAEADRGETSHYLRLQLPFPNADSRFAGDGFDYRRPASSTQVPGERRLGRPTNLHLNFIDLTNSDSDDDFTFESFDNADAQANPSPPRDLPSTEPSRAVLADFSMQRRERAGVPERGRVARPPRFGRDVLNTDVEVIDLSDDNVPSINRSSGPSSQPTHLDESPEVQFVSSRQVSPARRRAPPFPSLRSAGNSPDRERDFYESEFDRLGVLIVRESTIRPQTQTRRRPGQRSASGLGTLLGLQAHDFHFDDILRQRIRSHMSSPRTFVPPMGLDFQAVGFDMGLNEPDPPTYNPPPSAPEGFTRSPKEDDVLVCPNCDTELCTGETDLQKQVWVIKGCGHVYCGQCTSERAVSKRKEKATKSLRTPFKTCRVEGCEAKCSVKNSMIQLFL